MSEIKWDIMAYIPFKIVVIGKNEYSEIGKQRYLKNGNKYAVKTATSMQ